MSPRENTTSPPEVGAGPDSPHSGFGRHVHDALLHLYDPVYLQSHLLTRMLRGRGALQGPNYGQSLRQQILQALEELKPSRDGQASRGYEAFCLRYIEGMEATKVQAQLGLSRRQFYREHNRALLALVSLLSERWNEDRHESSRPPGEPTTRAFRQAKADAFEPLSSPGWTHPPSTFIGRERELAEVKAILTTTRLLTLTGAGGCGKTRLAEKVVSDIAETYSEGARVVELASLADPNRVPQAVAFALGVRDVPGRAIEQALVRFLEPRQTLLVLDNCEHLLPACARLVGTLLRECPRLQVLVTSREALSIAGETRWRVPSLSAPPPDKWKSGPVEVGRYEAVRLFTERARGVQPSFALTPENASAVAEICQRLDGIPLAIELAAARTRVLSVEEIVARLDDRFRLLTGGSRISIPRHRTLHATLDWSHDLLDEAERVLFRRLAVFSGGWTVQAAEAVCASEGVEDPETLDLLSQLVDKSLVLVEKGEDSTRYRFLETVREYAAKKMVDASEMDALGRRHRDWFVAFAERELPNTLGSAQLRCLRRLEAEQANFQEALLWSRRDVNGAEAELRLAGALAHFWRVCGHWLEGMAWLAEALSRGGTAVSAARARALTEQGVLILLSDGNPTSALAQLEQAVAVARQLDDPVILGTGLRNLGVCQWASGNKAAAEETFVESVAVGRSSGLMRELGSALGWLAWARYDANDPRTSAAMFAECTAVTEGTGEIRLLAEEFYRCGAAAVDRGEAPIARAALTKSITMAKTIGLRYMLAGSALMLGDVARRAGKLSEAVDQYAVVLECGIEAGIAGYVADAAIRLALLGAQSDGYDSAVTLLGWSDAWHAHSDSSGWHRLLYHTAGIREIGPEQERTLLDAREALDEVVFARAWEEGRAMSVEQAGALSKAMLRRLRETARHAGMLAIAELP